MDQNKLSKICIALLLLYVLIAVSFYYICGNQLRFVDSSTQMYSAKTVVGEIVSDTTVEQRIHIKTDEIKGISLLGATYDRHNTGVLSVQFFADDTLLKECRVDLSTLADNSAFYIPVDLSVAGTEDVILKISAPESAPGNAITLYYGNSIQAGKAQMDADIPKDDCVSVNGDPLDGALCMSINTRTHLWYGQYYWYFAAFVFVLLAVVCINVLKKNALGQRSVIVNLISAFTRYRYLIKQLVARDFKAKYKRSALGVLWSFLNPLLTMAVQYLVFSTLFKSNIPNFALYLLIGIVSFSFFNEATCMTLTSIVGNASLITKVYVPKYIYPLTRVMSSTINFLLALLPLFAVMLITRTPVRPSILLMPYPIICLFMVSLGIGMLLASSMVFFRDTQFLWGVVCMLWMYATPIFYPESILPAKLLPLFKCNPLYHIIRFIRIILIDGVSPEPKAYILMFISSVVPLIIGCVVFKKTQDRFVLNL